ncbi:hypothetical protein N0V85_004127 [Neurospora sp. IMI 360204]|nr:hypothetical protein N0V85_004127 [Neurospora sp. IMI 360204]
MARQSSRKRPLEHGPQDDRPAKTTKNSIDLPPVNKVKPSPDQTPHVAQTSPPSSASPPSLPTVSEDNHSANDCTTITLPLTRRNLKMFDKMSSKISNNNPGLPSRGSTRVTTNATSNTSGRKTPYSNVFQQFMEDAGIYMDDSRSKLSLANLKELRKERDVRRSLAPSQCSDGEIEDIIQATRVAASEQHVVQDIISRISRTLQRYRIASSRSKAPPEVQWY